ncbi:TSUP family transporter [Alteribacillus sp. JSM 102045]|uniref:TSUP family transporter n=1 Tax=Alteribacillus sp. JSM 102045 TaxID=1562101 RepID=UPI0035C0A329
MTFLLVKNSCFFSIPASIIGVFLSSYISGDILMIIFAIGIIFVGWQLFLSYRMDKSHSFKDIPLTYSNDREETVIEDVNGKRYHYTICSKSLAKMLTSIGGAFFGMVAVGLAELLEYQFLVRCRIPTPVAVATSIFVVSVTVIGVVIVRIFIEIGGAGFEELLTTGKIVMFTAPGVLVGGQIGPWLQAKMDPSLMKLVVALVLLLTGVFLLII